MFQTFKLVQPQFRGIKASLYKNVFSETLETCQIFLKQTFIYFNHSTIDTGVNMRETEFAIFELFRTNSKAELSTSEIVEKITPSYDKIQRDLFNQDRELSKNAKNKKAELHRLTLYYLNKLVRRGALSIKSIGKNKERVFTILNDLEELSPKYRLSQNTIGITPALGIEGFEEKGIVARYESANWVERVNSILLESTYYKNLRDLISITNNTLSSINDVIALNNFEMVIQKNNHESIITSLKSLNKQAESNARYVNLIIDMTNVENTNQLLNIIKFVIDNKLSKLIFIYDTDTKEFQDNKDFFNALVKIYSLNGQSLFIKNQTIHQAPYLVGKAGPYTFNEKEWKTYQDEFYGKMPGLVCGTITFLIDIERLFQNTKPQINSIIELMNKLSKSLLLTNAEQRERSEHFLKSLMNEKHSQNYFMLARNYIRFWNYGWKTPSYDQNFVIKYLSETKKAVDEYCLSEETIYNSCGMPTRFRISYSCLDQNIAKKIFSPENYLKISITNPTDFFSKEQIADVIRTKEKIFTYFDGGDRITFNRPVPKKAEDVVNEIGFILNSFRLPFFRYNFISNNEVLLIQYL